MTANSAESTPVGTDLNPETLKRKKAAIKGYFTRLENQIKAEGTKFTPSELEVKISRLQSYQKKIDDLREAFYEITEPDDLQEIEKELDDFDSRRCSTREAGGKPNKLI